MHSILYERLMILEKSLRIFWGYWPKGRLIAAKLLGKPMYVHNLVVDSDFTRITIHSYVKHSKCRLGHIKSIMGTVHIKEIYYIQMCKRFKR